LEADDSTGSQRVHSIGFGEGVTQSRRRFRQELKAATAAQHAALDEGLEAAFETIEGYAAFLNASRSAIAAIEADLARFGWGEAIRASAIEADLRALGARVLERRAEFTLVTEADACGAAYVLEGSALGGLSLAKLVQSRLGVSCTHYLRLRAANTMNHWQTFVDRLDDWGDRASEQERARATQAAQKTFDLYRHWFRVDGLLDERTEKRP
jgi:heme oxygenase